MNLYQINSEIQNRLAQLGELLETGDTPSQDEIQALLDLQGDLSDKLINYGKFIKNTQSDIDGLDGEIKRLTAKKKALQNRTEILKANMLSAMIENGIDKIADPIMPIRLQNSPASVRLDIDAANLPQEFQNIEIKANSTAIKKALKDGVVIDGVTLVQNKHVRIG
ncbi:Siphovirus Gp157 [Moraxella caviae]|uniref:Siphovirus Gp157 n=1 Tax=Moraxella caviae TaxID=34060 RepID=A0A378R7D2_9GAMM|nr:siphovirus Gp157 family protein [Moraxella caviae]STZ14007.1 Siphovirus Gp157 [Moraxella caviae]VEW12857.1 Siphovirus Gp157 [Moraxella caviae]